MTRTEIEQTMTELLDAADKLQDLIVDVRGIAARLASVPDTPIAPGD